jgi:hypothetical protein
MQTESNSSDSSTDSVINDAAGKKYVVTVWLKKQTASDSDSSSCDSSSSGSNKDHKVCEQVCKIVSYYFLFLISIYQIASALWIWELFSWFTSPYFSFFLFQVIQYREKCEDLEKTLEVSERDNDEKLRASEVEHTSDLETALAKLDTEQARYVKSRPVFIPRLFQIFYLDRICGSGIRLVWYKIDEQKNSSYLYASLSIPHFKVMLINQKQMKNNLF